MKTLTLTLTLTLFSLPSLAKASFSNCSQVFYGHTPPLVRDQSLAQKNIPLCFDGFAVNYSGVSKTGLWAAELLTVESLQSGKGLPRSNAFFEEKRVPEGFRALLSDYKGSGYDRGHLVAAGNRHTIKSKNESFSLANIIPQDPTNNQNTWRHLEEATRTMVTKNKEPVYVITGPLFLGVKLKFIGNSVLVPTHVYKVVLFPKSGVVGAWVATNDSSGRVDVVSVSELERYAKISFFPNLTDRRVLNYRYMLPLSANAAYKQKEVSVASDNQNSSIFQMQPNSAYKGAAVGGDRTYEKNREEVKMMQKESVNEGYQILKNILK